MLTQLAKTRPVVPKYYVGLFWSDDISGLAYMNTDKSRYGKDGREAHE